MAKVKVVLNESAVGAQLLKGGPVVGMCVGIAESMAANAGPGYAAKARPLGDRSGAIVYPTNHSSKRDNEQNNTLVKLSRSKVSG